jgi:peptidoglycan hydrolase CwlO-like protein
MALSDEWITKLQESLTDIKVSVGSVDSKLDQLSEQVKKLEGGFESLKTVTSSQETRIALLEEKLSNCSQLIPENLVEDFALVKAQLKAYQKFLWMTSSVLVGLVIKMLFDMM